MIDLGSILNMLLNLNIIPEEIIEIKKQYNLSIYGKFNNFSF